MFRLKNTLLVASPCNANARWCDNFYLERTTFNLTIFSCEPYASEFQVDYLTCAAELKPSPEFHFRA